jgi:hypothetical protein
MNANHLGTYVNDHLAGSVAAMSRLTNLISANDGRRRSPEIFEQEAEDLVSFLP